MEITFESFIELGENGSLIHMGRYLNRKKYEESKIQVQKDTDDSIRSR